MSKYSKLIGTVIGAVVGIGIAKGVLPNVMGDPELLNELTILVSSAIGTYLAPANTKQ